MEYGASPLHPLSAAQRLSVAVEVYTKLYYTAALLSPQHEPEYSTCHRVATPCPTTYSTQPAKPPITSLRTKTHPPATLKKSPVQGPVNVPILCRFGAPGQHFSLYLPYLMRCNATSAGKQRRPRRQKQQKAPGFWHRPDLTSHGYR